MVQVNSLWSKSISVLLSTYRAVNISKTLSAIFLFLLFVSLEARQVKLQFQFAIFICSWVNCKYLSGPGFMWSDLFRHSSFLTLLSNQPLRFVCLILNCAKVSNQHEAASQRVFAANNAAIHTHSHTHTHEQIPCFHCNFLCIFLIFPNHVWAYSRCQPNKMCIKIHYFGKHNRNNKRKHTHTHTLVHT